MRLNLLDELIADCMVIVAELGLFSAKLDSHFLGSGIDVGRLIDVPAGRQDREQADA
jgi:hypothetical protein